MSEPSTSAIVHTAACRVVASTISPAKDRERALHWKQMTGCIEGMLGKMLATFNAARI